MHLTRLNSPGEPLYHLTDIAERLGIAYSELRGYINVHSGSGRPRSESSTAPALPRRIAPPAPWRKPYKGTLGYYRLSDFRRWIREISQCTAS